MQRLLALQWTSSEASVLVAMVRGGRMRIEQALRIELAAASGDVDSPPSPALQLAEALKTRRLGRLPTVVTLDRSRVELRHLTVPAAPDEELPDLVRFQALRQFNSLEEHWPLDFIPLEGPADQDRYLLAATVHPELLGETEQLCETAGLKLARLVLRPCAAVSLAARRLGPGTGGTRLLVNVDGQETDLAVMVDGQVSFLRQARLEGDPLADPSCMPALVMELRRTMAAAQNQPGSRPVEGVVLLGAGQRLTTAAQSIAKELSLPTELVNPYDAVDWRDAEDAVLRDSPGRWSPLVGALWDEATETLPSLDFLHPRRRPEPPSRRNTYALAGLAAALLVLLVMVTSWIRGNHLQQELRDLQAENTRLEDVAKQAEKTSDSVKKVQEWMATEVNWLDELRWLSNRFTPADDAMLTGLKLNANSRRSEMTLDGMARDVQAIARLGERLQDKSHAFDLKSSTRSDAKPPYGMQFRSSLMIGK